MPAAKFFKNNFAGLGLILATWLLFFYPIIFGGYVYFLDDLKIIFYPLEDAYRGFQTQWQLPQWDPSFGFGHPLLAWGQLGFFTPLHMLLRPLPWHTLINLQISIVAYYLLGSIGMYAFLRVSKVSQLSAGLGAVIFSYCGFHIGHLNHVNFYTATMWLPWLLLSISYFTSRPTILTTTIISILAAIIALSGQPQIVLYTYIAALIIGIGMLSAQKTSLLSKKTYILIFLAGILALSLSSLSILPLYEFLPQTERAGGTTVEELKEFSYPAWHTITLVLPYFFGDHQYYWGAKGFQELAAYVGVIPLLLAGASLGSWRYGRNIKIAAWVLLLVGAGLALGKYSPFYSYLVDNHIVSSITTPGRFVYFFDTAIAILAAFGLDSVMQQSAAISQRTKRMLTFLGSMIFPVVILSSLIWLIGENDKALDSLLTYTQSWSAEWSVMIAGLTAALSLLVMTPRLSSTQKKVVHCVIVLLASGTLVIYGWDYNPRVPRKVALAPAAIADTIESYNRSHVVPARIYARELLLRNPGNIPIIKKTDAVSPLFSIYQPFQSHFKNLSCLELNFQYKLGGVGQVYFDISADRDSQPIRTVAKEVHDLQSSSSQLICFPPIEDSADRNFWLKISSASASNIYLVYQDYSDLDYQAFFVRKIKPTELEWALSRKNARLLMELIYSQNSDDDVALLARHIQSTTGSSSATWIGALSIRPYREFIDEFFANDQEPIDGDGLHAIERHHTLLNMAGVTHLAQVLPTGNKDGMAEAGYLVEQRTNVGSKEVLLYSNPDALPRAFMVRNAVYEPAADNIRYALSDPAYDPAKLIYISGPTPPQSLPPHSNSELKANANIVDYRPTSVTVKVDTAEDAFLVLTDAATAQWHTYIDGHPASQLVANSLFRAALVPAGSHEVTFKYESAAIRQAKLITTLSAAGLLILIVSAVVQLSVREKSGVVLRD